MVRRGLAAHEIFAEAPDGVNRKYGRLRLRRVLSIDDATCTGVNHGNRCNAHGCVSVVKAVAQPVEYDPWGIFAGKHRLVSTEDVFLGYIQDGIVLTGKGNVRVLSHSAAPHGYTHASGRLCLKGLIGLKDCLPYGSGDLCLEDHLFDTPGLYLYRLWRDSRESGQLLINGFRESVLCQETLKGVTCNNKAVGNGHAQIVSDSG